MAAKLIHLGLFAALLGACAAARPAPVPSLAWPPLPAQPRIRLAAVAGGLVDMGFSRPWYARAWDFVTGGDTESQFGTPLPVALRADWWAFGDSEGALVWLVNRRAESEVRISALGDEPLRAPVGLALAADGLWISDAELGLVAQVDFDGDLTRTLRGLERPAGLAVDGDGRLAVAQPTAHRITVFELDGSRRDIGVHGDKPGEFNFPIGVAFGPGGALYVNDALNFRVQRFDRAYAFVSSFGSRGDAPGYFARARGIAADARGNVYVTDALFDVVQIFDPAGELLLVVGADGHGPGEFWMPGGIAVDAAQLLVADTENRRLQYFEMAEAAP